MTATQPRLTSFAPQMLVSDLARSIEFYKKLGFSFDEPWEGFYAIGHMDGFEVHLKVTGTRPDRSQRRNNSDLDAAAGVAGIESFYNRCIERDVPVLKPLEATSWGTKDFYVEDPDGNILSFGGTGSVIE